MSTEYNLTMHGAAQNGEEYALNNTYPHDGVTPPPGMGWEEQSDGGGKFRLKRRRRCGHCGPCQVKENCNKCQFCLRKDVLKQACVYRKCVYLRKPVPRFRQECTTPGSSSLKSATTPPCKPSSTPVPPPASASSASSNSSGGGSINGAASNITQLPSQIMPSPASAGVSPSHSSDLSSCRQTQSPYPASSLQNNGIDPLRHRMGEHPHYPLFDPAGLHPSLDPPRTGDPPKPALADPRFFSGSAAPGFSNHFKPDQGPAAVTYCNDINSAAISAIPSSTFGSHSYQPSKGPSLHTRDAYFPSIDTWSSVPYGLPHAPAWSTSAMPTHHSAATYGFQHNSTAFPASFTPSSNRLMLPDTAAAQFTAPAGPQHSFHHAMSSMAGFSQDLTSSTSHANMRGSINSPFYPPSPHIPPSGISTLHGLGQFPTGQHSFAPPTYSMHAHSHMYSTGLYPFRTATEPQIYHVQIHPTHNPFTLIFRQTPFIFFREKKLYLRDMKLNMKISKNRLGHDISCSKYLDLKSLNSSSFSEKVSSTTKKMKLEKASHSEKMKQDKLLFFFKKKDMDNMSNINNNILFLYAFKMRKLDMVSNSSMKIQVDKISCIFKKVKLQQDGILKTALEYSVHPHYHIPCHFGLIKKEYKCLSHFNSSIAATVENRKVAVASPSKVAVVSPNKMAAMNITSIIKHVIVVFSYFSDSNILCHIMLNDTHIPCSTLSFQLSIISIDILLEGNPALFYHILKPDDFLIVLVALIINFANGAYLSVVIVLI